MTRSKVIEQRGRVFLMQHPDGLYVVEMDTGNQGEPEQLVKTTDKRLAFYVYCDYAQEEGL